MREEVERGGGGGEVKESEGFGEAGMRKFRLSIVGEGANGNMLAFIDWGGGDGKTLTSDGWGRWR